MPYQKRNRVDATTVGRIWQQYTYDENLHRRTVSEAKRRTLERTNHHAHCDFASDPEAKRVEGKRRHNLVT